MKGDWKIEEYTGDEDVEALLNKHKVTEVECRNCHKKFITFEGIDNHIVMTNHHLEETFESMTRKRKEAEMMGKKIIVKIHAVGDPRKPNLSWFQLTEDI